MNKNLFKRIISYLASVTVAATCVLNTVPALAQETGTVLLTADFTQDYENALMYVETTTYSEYYDTYSDENRPSQEVTVQAVGYRTAQNGTFSKGSYGNGDDVKDNVLIWKSSEGYVEYDVEIPETGIYCMNMTYFPIESNNSSIELSMKIDGDTPYDTASRITLNKVWVNETPVYEDEKGNQVRPPQIQKGMWCSSDIGDVDGLFNEPLIFYFEAGTHEISFESEKAFLAIESFKFYQPEKVKTYAEYKQSVNAEVSESDTAENIIRLEAEDAVYKSDSTLYPTYDNTSYLASPSSPNKVVYNTLGSGNWKKALQTVTWVIPADEIENDGWYKIGIKARQDEMRGLYSNRRIYIDGEVPCEELNQVKFYYNTDWTLTSPKTDNDYVYIYLMADMEHTLTMEAVPGEIGESMRILDDITAELNTYYRKILMITGPNPDKYTDYYVHEKIPELVDEFKRISGELKKVQSDIENLSGSKGSEAAALERLTVILDKCVEKPLKIPDYLSQIKDNIAAVSSWMRDYRDQPLEVDYIELATPQAEFADTDEKFFESLKFGFQSFIGSFFQDYTTLSDISGEDTIEVWVSLGRDQAQVVKEMTESEFMHEHPDIPIAVNLVAGGVVEASLAGKGPDVALFFGGEFPVNLASRGLLADLKQFPDYDEVKTRFHENATVNYEFDGGCYALPVSQNWSMMFYRTDVLSELGFTAPPETWQDLIDMLPALQRNYMSAGLVLPSANISPATEAGYTFASLVLQRGINYYNEEQTMSQFDSIEAVNAFEQWTDFYTKYSFVQTYDAFSRFRTGEYPIVIANYTFFNQLTAAAPEIKGLWDFVQIPGTLREDGTVSHATNSNGSGAVIFNKVKDKEKAWEFIKWFTETDTQAEYGRQIEGLMGTMGRFDTANTEALRQLSWSADELAKLFDQRDELEEIPIIPSSYAVTRNIMNAFREVVNNAENPRDTFMWYNRDINEEIQRKRQNLGLDE